MVSTGLEKYIEKEINYDQYLSDTRSVAEGKKAVPQEYLEYYALNLRRMERLDKTVKLSEEQIQRLEDLRENVVFIVISEGWCGDAAQILPVINKIAEASAKIEMKIVYRDGNVELMEQYLTNGSMSIPIVIATEAESGNELFHWGPRPAFGTELLRKYKAGEMAADEFKTELQKQYNKDKGNSIIEEILNKLKI